MKIISYILRMSLVALLFQCSSNHEIVPVKKLSAFPGTSFVPTLENTLPAGKNAIYAASLPFAWDEVKKLLQHPIEPGKNASENFKLLNNTISFKGCLGEDEYTSSAEMTPDGIVAKAHFRKDLPFRQKFDRLKKPLAYGKQKLLAFGMEEYDGEMVDQVEILYYKNDDDFIIKLTPANDQHEIIFIKKAGLAGSFKDIYEQVSKLTEQGNKERTDSRESWKYFYVVEDKLAVPVIRFNLETYYKDLSDQAFRCNNQQRRLLEVYQRTALTLDESGAIVESEVEATTDSPVVAPAPKPPKKFILNKPFTIFLKKTNSAFPYFAMKVENAELLVKHR